MELGKFINRINRLRYRMCEHKLWSKESVDDLLNDKNFGPKDLVFWEACFEEANRGFSG